MLLFASASFSTYGGGGNPVTEKPDSAPFQKISLEVL